MEHPAEMIRDVEELTRGPRPFRPSLQIDPPKLMTVSREAESPEQQADENPGFGWRHIQYILMFTSILGQVCHRSCLSIGVVAMTQPENPHGDEVFAWGRREQSFILSAFLGGYAVTHIPAGYLTTRFGAKSIVAFSLICSSIITLITPVVAHYCGWIGVTVLRVIIGLSQGATFPGTYTLLGKWSVPTERGRATAIISSALAAGLFLGMSVSGVIAECFGWPWIYYFFGVFSLLITCLWLFVAADSPEQHRWISKEECEYIVSNIGEKPKTSSESVPWRVILTSVPYIAAVIGLSGYAWTNWLCITALPRYMSDMFDFTIGWNGFLSGAPHLLACVVAVFVGWVSDMLIVNKVLSTEATRKLFNSFGACVPSITLVALAYTPQSEKLLQLVEIAVAIAFLGFIFSGVMANFVELSPRLSGLLFGIGNCVAATGACAAAFLCGYFVEIWGEQVGWTVSFCLAAGIFFVSNIFFLFGGTSDRQPWNDEPDDITKTQIERGGQSSGSSPVTSRDRH